MKPEMIIEELNKLCDGTLTITHYARWEIGSYGTNSLLSVERLGPVRGKSLKRAVTRALIKVELHNV
jgi:hypothetical protein